jgi:TRAP-type C4-dicarboxylate transport system permease small subunit
MRTALKVLNNVESIVCRLLLATFVCLLFAQIVSREVFGHSISWIEELSVYLFVWFVFLGASYAAKMAAHNRVLFQFRNLSRQTVDWIEGFADLFWIAFNVYFAYLSIEFLSRMNVFQKAQTLGVPMKYFYFIFPIAFTLMTIRIIQVNYLRLVKGEDIADPDKVDLDQVKKDLTSTAHSFPEASRNSGTGIASWKASPSFCSAASWRCLPSAPRSRWRSGSRLWSPSSTSATTR